MGYRVAVASGVLNAHLHGRRGAGRVTPARGARQDRTDDRLSPVSGAGHGVGFDPQQADRLFDAFHTTKPEGMGMGLSVSRSIIEAHGGRLQAEPNEGHGATFRFTLPADGRGRHE